MSDSWNLFTLFPDCLPFQYKDHIRGAFKKSLVFFPAYAAFAMLQTDKLLFHFSAAVGADFIVLSHAYRP